jgi:hypothetical protein
MFIADGQIRRLIEIRRDETCGHTFPIRYHLCTLYKALLHVQLSLLPTRELSMQHNKSGKSLLMPSHKQCKKHGGKGKWGFEHKIITSQHRFYSSQSIKITFDKISEKHTTYEKKIGHKNSFIVLHNLCPKYFSLR